MKILMMMVAVEGTREVPGEIEIFTNHLLILSFELKARPDGEG